MALEYCLSGYSNAGPDAIYYSSERFQAGRRNKIIVSAKGLTRGVGILFQLKVLYGALEYYSSERSYPRCLEQPVAVPLLDEPVGHAVRQLALTAVDQGSQRVGGRH